ncbi:peroxidase 15 [Setaria viridis]|uniref:peroxidase 15 n=1 Tax=Setaria viridis TaxID=4556 RepID=UPI003B3B000E
MARPPMPPVAAVTLCEVLTLAAALGGGVHDTVRLIIQQELAAVPGVLAGLLRLHFHDCFVNGCEGSLLLDGTAKLSEKEANPNKGTERLYPVVDNIKAAPEDACPGVVSCADILALAAKASVELMRNLRGAHTYTIGRAHYQSIQDRLYNLKATGQPDPTLDQAHLAELREHCPSATSDSTCLIELDPDTPDTFDNRYYVNLLGKRGLLRSDHAMFSALEEGAESTGPIVGQFASSQADFFQSFATAMVRMGNIAPLTRSMGEVRRNCRVVN